MLERGRKLLQNLLGKNDLATTTESPIADVAANDALARAYDKIAREMEKRFAITMEKSANWQTPGQIEAVNATGDGLRLTCERAHIQIRSMAPHILEVRLRQDEQWPDQFSYAIDPEFVPNPVSPAVQEEIHDIHFSTDRLSVRFERATSQFDLKLDGQTVIDQGTLAWRGPAVRFSRQLPEDESCHGLGERASGLNLRGRRWQLWNWDPFNIAQGYQRDTDPIYYSIPFYFGMHPRYAVGLLWDNPARGSADLDTAGDGSMQITGEANELRFYLIVHEDPNIVLQQYMLLTGKPPMPPLWIFGYHQSRYSYRTPDEFKEIAREFRERGIPCDILHFDIDYMDQFKVFTWNKAVFGDLKTLVTDLRAQGFRSIAILDPGIKVEDGYGPYEAGLKADAFLKYPDDTCFIAPVWAGNSAFPDFTDPQGRAFWSDQVAAFIQKTGFDGVWNDMNEPTIFAPEGPGTIPDYIQAEWDGHGPRTQVAGAHNTYGMLMARATYEGLQQQRPNKRAYTLTRAAYAGAQRYTASWTGDNDATWDHLKLSVSMLLNIGLSGIYFTGPDIGGFFNSPTPELYARWIQVASLFPFCRTHTVKGTPSQEPWDYGTAVEAIARDYLTLRYRLLPYLYASYVASSQQGIPFIRPVFLTDRSDRRLQTQDDVFMVGDSLLVAPVLDEGHTSKTFYLPKGAWYNFWTRSLAAGGREITVDAPLNRMPIYVRAGSVVPMWQPQQYLGEKPIDELHLMVFAGSGETAHYEDAGEGLEYLDGGYRWSYFTTHFLPGNQFAVDWRTAGQYSPPYTQTRVEIIGINGQPHDILVNDQPGALWFYEDGTVEVLTSPFNQIRVVGNPEEPEETIVRRPPGLEFQ